MLVSSRSTEPDRASRRRGQLFGAKCLERNSLGVWEPRKPLKSHKTAKGIFGKAWRKLAEIWKSLQKSLGARRAIGAISPRLIVDLPSVSVAGIAARENLNGKTERPEMAPQRLEKIESAPGNGRVSEAWRPQDLVCGRGADRALRPTRREAAQELRSCRKRRLEL